MEGTKIRRTRHNTRQSATIESDKRCLSSTDHNESGPSNKKRKISRFVPPKLKTVVEETCDNNSKGTQFSVQRNVGSLATTTPSYVQSQLDDSLEERKEGGEEDACYSQSLCGSLMEEEVNNEEERGEGEEERQEIEEEEIKGEVEEEVREEERKEEETEGEETEGEETQDTTTSNNTKWSLHRSIRQQHPSNITYQYSGRNYSVKTSSSNKENRSKTINKQLKITTPSTDNNNVFDFPVSQVACSTSKQPPSKQVPSKKRNISSTNSSLNQTMNDSMGGLHNASIINNRTPEEQRAINAEVLRILAETKAEMEERKEHYAKLRRESSTVTISVTIDHTAILKNTQSQLGHQPQELSFFLSGSEE